jgi:hypothetical protein
MAIIQLNPPGMQPTDPGYISSITVYTSGSAQVKTPDGNGQITVDAQAATRLVGGNGGGGPGLRGQQMYLVTG